MSGSVEQVFAAVDLGASSGRVMAGIVSPEGIRLEEVHRFGNGPVHRDGHLHWDLETLWAETLTGLQLLVERWPQVRSIGIDTWAVDYGLVDAAGRLARDPYCYRDSRTDAVIDRVHTAIGRDRLYAVNGLQFLPFNTVYQLASEPDEVRHGDRTMLLVPDLLAHRLTGARVAEITNASTTGLLDATTRTWSDEVRQAIDLDPAVLPPLVEPGTTIGTVQPGLGLPAVPVVAVGSHDTASAVVGVPGVGEHWAYVSSGTWSLVGVELPAPVLSDASREANFTNEGGVDGTVRYLRNVGGLWLLEQCRAEWGSGAPGLSELITAAGNLAPGGPTVDVDDPEFIAPGSMPARITAAVERSGRSLPSDPVVITRCILDSLALAYARTIDRAAALTGRTIEVVHIVGGGAQNAVLCQLTADATGRDVLAGPVEATALGNIAIQARAAGAAPADLAGVRALIARSARITRYASTSLDGR